MIRVMAVISALDLFPRNYDKFDQVAYLRNNKSLPSDVFALDYKILLFLMTALE